MNPAKGGTRLDDFSFKHSFQGTNDLPKELKMKVRVTNEEAKDDVDDSKLNKLVDYSSSSDDPDDNESGSDTSEASDDVDDLLKELEHKEPVQIDTQFKMKRKWDNEVVFNNKIAPNKKAKHVNDSLNSAQHKQFMSKLFK